MTTHRLEAHPKQDQPLKGESELGFPRKIKEFRPHENTRNCVTRAPLAPRVDKAQARRGAGTSQSSYYYYYSSIDLTHESPTVPLVLLGPGSGFFCFLSRFHSQTFTDTPLV